MAKKHRQRCRVCGDEAYLHGGVCKKAGCLPHIYDRDLPPERIEAFFAQRAEARRKGRLARPTVDPWARRGSSLDTPALVGIGRRS